MKIKKTIIIEEKEKEILEQAEDIIRNYCLELEDTFCDNDRHDYATALRIIGDLILEEESF